MPETDAAAAWAQALAELEARLPDLAHGEQAAAVADWRPPAAAGPIPADLVARAQALAVAQERVGEHLRAALADTARHLTALRCIPSGTPRGASVYLDVTG